MKNSKHIEGFENYLIFPAGKVYSLKSNRFLKPYKNLPGYYLVGLYKSGKRYPKLIARLVAQAFIPNLDNKPEINHIDGNKANNDVTNLEWCTHSENMLHAYATGLQKPSPNSGNVKVPVNVYNYFTGKFLSAHSSISDAARIYGLFYSNISQVLLGKRKYTGGLTFKRI